MRGPLEGVRVVDFSRVVAGPYCAMVLGDLGADVIKVERPDGGDDTRGWGPPYAAGESAYYLSLNRNKRSVCLDLKAERDLKVAHKLIARSDVLLHNFLPGAAERLGLGYAQARERNERIVYAHISGYGSSGPDAHRPAYDLLAQAETGFMSITGDPGGLPQKVGVAVLDVLAGLNAAIGILAKLYARRESGAGGLVESSLLEAGLASLINVAGNYLVTGQPPRRYGNAHANIVPYQLFETADKPIVIAAGNDRQFMLLCQALQRSWAEDERYRSNDARVRHRNELVAMIQEVLAQEPLETWLVRLRALGVPCAPVAGVPEVLEGAQVTARAMLQEVAHPGAGRLRLVAGGFKLDAQPTPCHTPPPRLGEHGEDILRELEEER